MQNALDFLNTYSVNYSDLIANTYLGVSAAQTDEQNEKLGKASFFWSYLRKLRLQVHQDFFKNFDVNYGFETIDTNGVLTYFSANILNQFKTPLDIVLKTPFHELFKRDDAISAQIMDIFIKSITAEQKTVIDLTSVPKHTVTQLGFPDDDFYVEFKHAYPLFFDDGLFYGYVITLKVSSAQ